MMKHRRRDWPFSPEFVDALHWVALGWALLAILGLIVATEANFINYRPGGDAYELRQQQAFGIGYIIAIIVSLRWKLIGGTLAAVTAAGILAFARNLLEPLDAFIVVFAFAVPGILWIFVDLYQYHLRWGAVAIALIGVALLAGGSYATNIYEDLYGPSHPESSLDPLPASAVQWTWSGGITPSSAIVTARLESPADAVRLAVSTGDEFESPRFVEPTSYDDHRVARFDVTGLTAATRYHFAVEADGELDLVRSGSFKTHPAAGPASFTFGFASCMRVGANGAVFDTIREIRPDFFIHMGDFHYGNIGENSPAKFRELLDFQLSGMALSAMLREVPIAYVWDDHDYGSNNADATSPSRPAALQVYREYVPHYPLASDDSPIYQAFTVGRVRFILTDTRSARSPSANVDDANKTMLGDEQKAWFKQELAAANGVYPLVIWVNSVPWIAEALPGGDSWGGYTTERTELADYIAEHLDDSQLLMLSGDAHMLAFDDGTNSDFSTAQQGGFPVFHAAALDRPGHVRGGPYTIGPFPGAGQFGIANIVDHGGNNIRVELTGQTWSGAKLIDYSFTVPVPR